MTHDETPIVRYGDDVAVGDELPEIIMELDWTTMALQVSGSQDWNEPHHDPDFAKDSGMSGIFYNTGWTTGLFGRLLTDWAGREGWVERLSLQMRGMHMNGDTVRAHGTVTAVTLDSTVARVEIELGLSNQRLGLATPASATVRLPRRASS
jgi:acyl dehydratase